MKIWFKKQFRKKARIYIMPTKMGGYLNGLIFLMFLLAIGYSNNLLLIFSIFLFAFNLLWLIQTHVHLYRLKLDQVIVSSGHAMQLVPVNITWKVAPQNPWDWQIALEGDRGDFECLELKNYLTRSEGEITFESRGVHRWKYLQVKTANPFGLYRAWVYFPLNFQSLVYPTLLKSVELNLSGIDERGELSSQKKGDDDFRGLGNYNNQESRKISWKHYARSGELLIKEGEEKQSSILDLKLMLPSAPEAKEYYLSYLATQIVECHKRDIPFSFSDNGLKSSQIQECLKVLALC